ncbi:MAG: chemotaxis response regulator protein-glutamate methylesterase [Enterobacterales bacterium]|nr:chemotaxis response regulator protein-glutamate methylesterase [Enterobacterales bacterium]
MTIKVLIVDDSQFFCRRVGAILTSAHDIKVIGVAHNGKEAIEKAQELKPDVITLDVEMPVMDGVTALKQIVKVCDAKVLMLSSLTYDNAKITLDALDAGATDFLLKSYESLANDNDSLVTLLQSKIRELGQISGASVIKQITSRPIKPKIFPTYKAKNTSGNGIYNLLAIGASTGGPVALQKLLVPLPQNFPCPITVTQHMPGTFTGAFAARLNGICKLSVYEATDGMTLKPGHVYIAPGGKQMVFEGSTNNARIRIRPADSRVPFSPSVDLSFGSASKIFGQKLFALVLTGMGSDGTEGSKLIKAKGGKIWVQNEASCVVYGMPMSVTRAGLSDRELALENMASELMKEI